MQPEYVTDTVERKVEYNSKHVHIYNVYPGKIIYNLWDDFPKLLNLSVHKKDIKIAEELSFKLHLLGPLPKKEQAEPIVNQLLELRLKDNHELSALEKWEQIAPGLPGDIGGPNKKKFKEIITKKCKGKVLETMAGFNTYVFDSSEISEVIALDYSKEMLQRYPISERKRILFDLNKISSEEIAMNFFKEGQFNTITCCYGANYLENPKSVFKEFYRILSKKGKLLILNNTSAGYQDIQKSWFDPEKTSEEIESVGFSSSIESFSELNTEWEVGDYYIITGTKD